MNTQFLLTVFLVSVCLCGCSDSSSTGEQSSARAGAEACVEPRNPYDEGTGHYSGYEWAENHSGAVCNGNSNSFNEGCEEYNNQQEEYVACERRKK